MFAMEIKITLGDGVLEIECDFNNDFIAELEKYGTFNKIARDGKYFGFVNDSARLRQWLRDHYGDYFKSIKFQGFDTDYSDYEDLDFAPPDMENTLNLF
jgi:hypothetical protein